MLIIPAIDLQNGRCVRLEQGDFNRATAFSDDPQATANKWLDDGAARIHLVDLDGARQGRIVHRRQIESVAAAACGRAELQVGGGLRNLSAIRECFNLGADYAVVGTAAIENPLFLREACDEFKGRILLGLDSRDGVLAIRGWESNSKIRAADFARELPKELALAGIIHTDISKDGMQSGVNFSESIALAKESQRSIIASGGVKSLDDIRAAIKFSNLGIAGLIIGKAIYSGELKLKDAIKLTCDAERQAEFCS